MLRRQLQFSETNRSYSLNTSQITDIDKINSYVTCNVASLNSSGLSYVQFNKMVFNAGLSIINNYSAFLSIQAVLFLKEWKIFNYVDDNIRFDIYLTNIFKDIPNLYNDYNLNNDDLKYTILTYGSGILSTDIIYNDSVNNIADTPDEPMRIYTQAGNVLCQILEHSYWYTLNSHPEYKCYTLQPSFGILLNYSRPIFQLKKKFNQTLSIFKHLQKTKEGGVNMLRKGNNSRSRININISFDKDNVLCNYIDLEITFKYNSVGCELNCEVVGGFNYYNNSAYAHYGWRRVNSFSRFYCIFNATHEKTLSFGNIPYTTSNKKIVRVIAMHKKTTDSLNMNRQYYLFSFYSIENQVIDVQIVKRGYDSKYNSYTAPINNSYADVWSGPDQTILDPPSSFSNLYSSTLDILSTEKKASLTYYNTFLKSNNKEVLLYMLRENINLNSKVSSVNYNFNHINKWYGGYHADIHPIMDSCHFHLMILDNRPCLNYMFNINISNLEDYPDYWIKTSNLNLVKLCQFKDAKNSYYINTDWMYVETVNNKTYYLQIINSTQLEGINPNTHTLWIDQDFNLYVGVTYTDNHFIFYTNPTKYTSAMNYDTVYNMIGYRCFYLKKNLNLLSVKHLLNNFNDKEVA